MTVSGARNQGKPTQTTTPALVIGYLRSYENMATANVFIDGDLEAEIEGLWSDRSSQYNSVGFDVDPGRHIVDIEVQPDLSSDKQRGLNKFKLLEILVY